LGYGDFDAGVRAAATWLRVVAALDSLVTEGPPKVAAGRLGIDATTLGRKLETDAEKAHRNVLHARELVLLLVSAPAKHAEAVLAELAGACGFAVVPFKEQTPEERLEQLERLVIGQYGPSGADLVEKNRRRR